MSINTANLITTANGQEALATVHSLNKQLSDDKRGILVNLSFPYMAISKKTPEAIEEIEASTEEDVRAEPCWSNVDICQVQKYVTSGVTKRDFTLGGLFNVQEDISGAVTVILFAQSHIIDNRTEAQKAEDGYQSAANVLLQEYGGYTETMLPYAYTRLLDSTGTYSPEGIDISASRYGRSRHRFYFNYIIDNNDGIANNITINDNVYPYSDGYLSKTAFELGLKRYEDALAQYDIDYQKYANGRNVSYRSLGDAMDKAVPRHKFYVNVGFIVNLDSYINMNEYSLFRWEKWPVDDYPSPLSAPEVYKGLIPKQFDATDPFGGTDTLNDSERGMFFRSQDVRRVKFTDLSGDTVTKNVEIDMQCLLFLRTSMPNHEKMPFRSTYNYMRLYVGFLDSDLAYAEIGIEIPSATGIDRSNSLDMFFSPQMPSVGEIEIKETEKDPLHPEDRRFEVSFLLMTQDVKYKLDYYDSNIGDGNGHWFYQTATFRNVKGFYVEHSTNPQDAPQISIQKRIDLKNGGDFVVPTNDDLTHASGSGLYWLIQPNFAAGYVLAEPGDGTSLKRYILPKDFDKNGIGTSETFQSANFLPDFMYVMDDSACFADAIRVRLISKWAPSAPPLAQTGKLEWPVTNFNRRSYIYDSSYSTSYRIMCDAKLHNARVMLCEQRTGIQILSSTKVFILIYTGKQTYEIRTDYAHLIGSDSTLYNGLSLVEITNLRITKKYWFYPDGQDNKYYERPAFDMSIDIHKGTGSAFTVDTIKASFAFSPHAVGNVSEEAWTNPSGIPASSTVRWVAIEDAKGDINAIEETVC